MRKERTQGNSYRVRARRVLHWISIEPEDICEIFLSTAARQASLCWSSRLFFGIRDNKIERKWLYLMDSNEIFEVEKD